MREAGPEDGVSRPHASEYGVTSMVDRLRRVAMRRPGRALLEADPATWHYAGPLDADRLLSQFDRFASLVEDAGAEIAWMASSDEDGLADAVFTYDPSFMVRDGAVLLRPGKPLREPEVEIHRRFYETEGIPILGTIEPPGVAEGGDLFWLDERTLAVGRGFRTNRSGIDQLRDLLAPGGVELRTFDLPTWDGDAACLHLLSLLSPLDVDLVLAYRPLVPVALYQTLRERGVEILEAPEPEFVASRGLNLNVLALAPRDVIAVGGFPETIRLMREAGCDVATFDADALCVPCEGGPTCLTRPLLRSAERR
ncbi:MAG: arginine deiminase family protein [Gemmatimonadetes bacterium]|nr:arginine deiminase family protein [Gemmatimonadota bacterium]